MSHRTIRTLVALLALSPLCAFTQPASAQADSSKEARLEQRVKELEAYAKSLEQRVAELSKNNTELKRELKRELDQRMPRFRFVIPPDTNPSPLVPRLAPGLAPTPSDERDWQRSGSGNTWHYLIPADTGR